MSATGTTRQTMNAATVGATQDQGETIKAKFMEVVSHIFKRQLASNSVHFFLVIILILSVYSK